MTVLLPEVAELSQLSEFLLSFMTVELESSKLREFMGGKRTVAETALSSKLKELDLATAFSDGTTPESGLPGLAQLAYESGRGLMPLALWENMFSGPYLFGQLKSACQGLPVADILSGKSKVIAVPASKLKRPIRGLSSSEFLVAFSGNSADVFKTPSSAAELSDELDLVGSYSSVDDKQLTKVGSAQVPATYASSFSLLVAAELSGIAAKAVAMTVEYLKIRKQFDVPVGGFQAVQHKAADMHLHSEAMAALVSFALRSFSTDTKEFTIAAESALSYASEYTGLVLETAIQLHGGIGFTWEHDLHLYLRRAKQLEFTFGPTEQELQRIVEAVK
jgi:hypothetical protein